MSRVPDNAVFAPTDFPNSSLIGIGMAASVKPPLGVMPQRLWREQRAKELSRAIREYMEAGIYPPVIDWIEELHEIWPQVATSRP